MNALVGQLTKLSLGKSLAGVKTVRLLLPRAIDEPQKRNRGSTVRLNRGAPRPPQPFKAVPRGHDYRYRPILPLVSDANRF